MNGQRRFFFLIIFILFLFHFWRIGISIASKGNTIEVISPKSADKEIASPVKLQKLIEFAMENNPGIKAAKLEWSRIIQKYPQAISLDDPMIIYAYSIKNVETRTGPQKQIFKLSQKIPFPGKLSLKGDVVIKEVEIAKTNFEKELRNVIVAIKKSYYELFYIRKAAELTTQNNKILEHFNKIGASDYAKEATSLNDVLKAQSQYAQSSYDLILLQELETTEITRLNTLINRDPETPIQEIEEPEIYPFKHSLNDLYKWASHNEELQVAELTVEKSRIQHKLSKYQYYPDFKVGVDYIDTGIPLNPNAIDAGKDAVRVVFGFNIPIWFSKNKSVVQEANVNIEKFEKKKEALNNEIMNKIKKTFFTLNNSDRLIKLYKDSLIPQAKQSMEIAETWYKNGQGSLSGLLETQSMWLNFQLAYYRAAADYLKGITSLERLVGKSLF